MFEKAESSGQELSVLRRAAQPGLVRVRVAQSTCTQAPRRVGCSTSITSISCLRIVVFYFIFVFLFWRAPRRSASAQFQSPNRDLGGSGSCRCQGRESHANQTASLEGSQPCGKPSHSPGPATECLGAEQPRRHVPVCQTSQPYVRRAACSSGRQAFWGRGTGHALRQGCSEIRVRIHAD